jgi:AraC-like DNA-binding protein
MLAGYFVIIRHPDTFLRVRAQIGKEHARKFTLSREEAAKIHTALMALVADPAMLGDEDLDLPALAERIGVPSYRLSHYFNARLSTTFSIWMNAQRVAYVKKRMLERPDLGILEIALEAGYKSKTTFNTQFSRIVGMSPSEYRGSKERRTANATKKNEA